MSDYVISPPPQVAVPVAGGGLFPVRRIYCVGRNYAEHAREMGHDPNAEPPFFFSKPADALLIGGADSPYPTQTSNFHHEIELVAAIGTGGSEIPVETAINHVWGYGVGIDLTRRDLQAVAKEQRLPWDIAKGFDASAPITAIVPVASAGHDFSRRLWLEVNGELRQQAPLSDMVFSVAEIIHELSKLFALKAGDLIFMGTPSGVAALQRGDRFHAGVDGLAELRGRILQ